MTVSLGNDAALSLSLLNLLTYAGIGFLVFRSEVRRQPTYFLPMLLGSLVLGYGWQSTFRHWPFNQAALISGALLVWLPAALWFARRLPPSVLATLKMLWLTGLCSSFLLLATDGPGLEALGFINQLLFWVTLLFALYQSLRKRRQIADRA